MAVLLIGEVINGEFGQDATAKTLSAVASLGDVDILIADENPDAAAAEAAKLAGVRSVITSKIGHGLAEPIADLVVGMAGDYSHIVAPATAAGKNVAQRIAALLDVMVITDASGVVDADTFERPIYAGNAIQTVKSKDEKKVLTIRTSNFDAAGEGGSASVSSVGAPSNDKSSFVEDKVETSDRPELTSAKIVVSGGRGVGSEEDFKLIENLADTLGAAVGASRAAVDSGFAPNDWQVGQTGKVVAPDLYMAIGISGAIQHLAGMKDSKVIVAINKDAEAPIFQVADYGLVADLFDAVPELTEKLKG